MEPAAPPRWAAAFSTGGGSGGRGSDASDEGDSAAVDSADVAIAEDSGAGGIGAGGAAGTGGASVALDCNSPGLIWKTGAKTNFIAYPQLGSEQCIDDVRTELAVD